MASSTELQSFQSSWQQTAAWAQSKGIKYNQYYPIYQMDSQRVLQYGSNAAMSTAEREHAIQAAADPNVSTQLTPSTASNPSNVIGNTITDARNIFTGLIHAPQTLTDQVKNTFDDITSPRRLFQQGNIGADLGNALTSTVLSWVPGATDVGTVLSSEYGPGHTMGWRGTKGDPGFAALASHPITSILDVLPMANELVAAKVARDSDFAARIGADAEGAPKPSLGRMVKGYVMNSQTGRLGPSGLMTVGDLIHEWVPQIGNPVIGDAVRGVEETNTHYTTEEKYYFNDVEDTWSHLDSDEQEQLADLWDPTQRSNLEDRLKNPDLSPRVVQISNQILDGPLRFQKELTIASEDGPSMLRNPRTGQMEVRATTGKSKSVFKAAQNAKALTEKVLNKDPEMKQLREQTDTAMSMFQAFTQSVDQATDAARQAEVDVGNFAFQPFEAEAKTRAMRAIKAKTKIAAGVSHKDIATKLVGTGGFMDQLVAAARDGRFDDIAEVLGPAAMRRLDTWGIDSVDVESNPAFQTLKAEVEKLTKSAKIVQHLQKKADKEIHGKADRWKGGKGYRDEQHQEEAKKLSTQHSEEIRQLRQLRKQQFAQLKYALNIKRRDIRTTAADAKRAADAWVRDQTRNITEKFELEKGKAETAGLLARETHQEWLRGRAAQGLPGARADYIQSAQEGTRIAPGAAGSREGIQAAQDGLEAQKQKALRDMEAQAPNKAAIDAKMTAELRAADQAERLMTDRLKTAYGKYERDVRDRHDQESKDFDKAQKGQKGREGETSKLLRQWTRAQKEFSDEVWKHPSDNYVDLFFSLFTKHLMDNEKVQSALETGEKRLAKKFNWGQQAIEDYRANPTIVRQMVQLGVKGVFDDPLFEGVDPKIISDIRDSALTELDQLAKDGVFPQYVPHVSETQLRADATGSYGIRTVVGKGVPKPDVLSGRVWDTDHSKYDLMAGIHRGVKQMLDRAAIVDYAKTYLAPKVVTRSMLRNRVIEYYQNDVANLRGQALEDFVDGRIEDFNLEKFNPVKYGYKDPAWGDEDVYINSNLINSVKKITNDGRGLATRNVYDSATRLFRYSILGLSPRYTAHILFGGTTLLALREPLFFRYIPDALRSMKEGQDPEHLATTMTQMGTTEYEISSLPKALNHYHAAGGKQSVLMMLHEHMEKVQGIARGAEKPLHWLKAMADLNLHFTSYLTHLQRSIAYTAGAARAEAHGVFEDEAGNMVRMTKERAMMEGMHNAERVMGDLRTMSPFERQVARYAMPFYGWQKHILKYVLSFPADHPWRAMMLANLAEFATENEPGGLPSRYQFLFFLGHPDAQGNVTGIDIRQIDPLRDVANYATVGGIVSSLNPVITATAAYIDPQIIYGGNTLYPNLTYDQFYGIDEAGPQGNILTAASQIVPEASALQSAMQVAGQRRGMSSSELVKNIGESLNFPWVPQHINLRQEAAKTAIAQYQVTKNLAENAWQTGDFQSIQDLGSVPDPRNADYETPVTDLEAMYNQLAEQYPGQAPADVAPSLPSVHL